MAGRAEVLLGNREELRKCTGGRMNRPEIGIPGWGKRAFGFLISGAKQKS